eukprot:1158655-Pelagomonas_calceolata.AAC.5
MACVQGNMQQPFLAPQQPPFGGVGSNSMQAPYSQSMGGGGPQFNNPAAQQMNGGGSCVCRPGCAFEDVLLRGGSLLCVCICWQMYARPCQALAWPLGFADAAGLWRRR